MSKRIVNLLAAAVMTTLAAWADNGFFATVDRLVDSSPELKALAARSMADSLSLHTENNLPAPEISFENLFGVYGDKKYNAGISQGFDWPGLYAARGRAARAADALRAAEYAADRQALTIRTAGLLADIVASRQKIASCSEILAMYDRLLSTYNREFENGNVSILDVNKLRIEVADLTQTLEDEKLNLDDLTTQIIAISGNDEASSLIAEINDFPEAELSELDDYRNRLPSTSPELSALRARCELDRNAVNVSRLSNMPGFSLGYRYAYEERQSFNGFAVNIELPLWSNKGKKRAAEAQLLATDFEAEALLNQQMSALNHDYAVASNLQTRIAMLEKALNAADNIGLLRKAFDAGEIALTSFIQDVRFFMEAEMSLSSLRADYFRSLLSLNRYR